jgi:hypothetical protein
MSACRSTRTSTCGCGVCSVTIRPRASSAVPFRGLHFWPLMVFTFVSDVAAVSGLVVVGMVALRGSQLP